MTDADWRDGIDNILNGAANTIRAPAAPLTVGWLQPDDISPAAVFLASDAAARVTGEDGAKDV